MKYPKLREGGGFEFLRCVPNSRVLELMLSTVSRSCLLKSVVNSGRIYIRPLQKDLDLGCQPDDDDTSSSEEVRLTYRLDTEVEVSHCSSNMRYLLQ